MSYLLAGAWLLKAVEWDRLNDNRLCVASRLSIMGFFGYIVRVFYFIPLCAPGLACNWPYTIFRLKSKCS